MILPNTATQEYQYTLNKIILKNIY